MARKKCQRQLAKVIRTEKAPWVGRIWFFFLGTLGLIRAWRGETDGESLLSRRFTARFAQIISQERLVRRGARIGGYVFETKKKVWIALHESWRLHTLAKQRGP